LAGIHKLRKEGMVMIEAQYLQMLMNSEFTVFEVTKGWYIHEIDGFELGARKIGLPFIQEPVVEWFYRDGEPHVKEVELTSNVLYAQKFDAQNSEAYKEALDFNFPDGRFVNVKAKTTLQVAE
jgi:hypothetical protein